MRREHQPRHAGAPEGDRQTTVVVPGRHAAPSPLHGRRWLIGAAAAIATLIVVLVGLATTVGQHHDVDRPPAPLITPGDAAERVPSGSPTPTAGGSVPGGPGTPTAGEQGGAAGPGATTQPQGAPNHPAVPSHKPKPSRTAEPSRSPRPSVSTSPTPQPTASTTPSGSAAVAPTG